VLVASGQIGCGDPSRVTLPDAGQTDAGSPALRVQFVDPGPLRLEPGAVAAVPVRVSDAEGRPARAEVRFALLGASGDATLLETRAFAEPSADGATVARGSLRASNASALFTIRASTPDGAVAVREVSVSDRGFGAIRVAVDYFGVRGPSGFDLSLFTDGRCDALRAARADRIARLPDPTRGSAIFPALTADREYAVRVEGVGPRGEVVSVGCVQAVRVERDAERAVAVRPEDLSLHAQGVYEVRVQLGLDVVARSARALWLESTSAGVDEPRVILRAIAEAVERSSGPPARQAFERVVEERLAGELAEALRARDALPSRRLTAFADGLAASIGGARWIVEGATRTDEGSDRFEVRRVRLSVDPQTPADPSDDLLREVAPSGIGRVALLPGDRVGFALDGAPLPASELAVLARDAHLSRLGFRSTAERLRAEVRCESIAPLVTPHAIGCDAACVAAACDERLDEWARRFDEGLTLATSTLRTARVAFVGVGLAPSGTVTLHAVASSAVEGSFTEDPSRPIRGAATLARP
jgi:hypothetical protein